MKRWTLAFAVVVLITPLLAGEVAPSASSTSNGAAVTFQEVTRQAGIAFQHTNGATLEKYMPETMGAGVVVADFTGDGWPDIFFVTGGSLADKEVAARSRHALYRNNRDGTFSDITVRAGIRVQGYGMGGCAADFNNDGWIDLYITGFSGNALYRNNGDGTFTDVTEQAGVAVRSWSTGCAFGDIDNDGHVDAFVANYVDFALDNNKFCGDAPSNRRLYCHPNVYNGLPSVLFRNKGNGSFEEITKKAGVHTSAGKSLGVVFTDYDGDGRLDLFIANDSVPNFLYRNRGDGAFEEVGMLAGVAVAMDGRPRAGMGTDFGDVNNDGLLDVVVTNLNDETHTLYLATSQGLFVDATAESGLAEATRPFVGWGTTFFDYDNDGDLDLVIANGNTIDNIAEVQQGNTYPQPKLLLRNEGDSKFRDVTAASGPGFALVKPGRGLAVADFDNDGDLDIVVVNVGQRPDLLRNDGGNRRNSLLVRTIGTTSNRDGIGARIKIHVGGTAQMREIRAGSSYLSQHDMRAHFGLGSASQVDRLEVRWPSGNIDVLRNVRANQIITVKEGQGLVQQQSFVGCRHVK
jgi:hypothetical protein